MKLSELKQIIKEELQKVLLEKRFAGKKELDKDGDGVPKWADKDDSDPKVGSKSSKNNEEEDESLEEKKMSKSQMGKREKFVKGMKSAAKDFSKRYGSRGKDVMYATATDRKSTRLNSSHT